MHETVAAAAAGAAEEEEGGYLVPELHADHQGGGEHGGELHEEPAEAAADVGEADLRGGGGGGGGEEGGEVLGVVHVRGADGDGEVGVAEGVAVGPRSVEALPGQPPRMPVRLQHYPSSSSSSSSKRSRNPR